jgi:hypothetical protein
MPLSKSGTDKFQKPYGEPSVVEAYTEQDPRCRAFVAGLPDDLVGVDIDEFLKEAESQDA